MYDPASGTWTATGSLNTARSRHNATLLANGKVLVASDGQTATAEVLDPADGSWAGTGSLANAHYNHSATLLPNGKVLVAGGYNGIALTRAELYDPASGTWATTGSLATERHWDTATFLPRGKVLVAGGSDSGFFSATPIAELYDPATGTWTVTGSLAVGRLLHTATLLANGMVLITGGLDRNIHKLASCELYDPASEPGRQQVAWPPNVIGTRRRSCPAARFSSQAVIATAALSRAVNSMIRRAEAGP
jgi:hypothetical protein